MWRKCFPCDYKMHRFSVAPCCCKGRLCLSLCYVLRLFTVHGMTPPPPPSPLQKHDFWAAQAILSNFHFFQIFFQLFFYLIIFSIFFSPKFFFHLKTNFPLLFFLDVSSYPECSKTNLTPNFFQPKFFFNEL